MTKFPRIKRTTTLGAPKRWKKGDIVAIGGLNYRVVHVYRWWTPGFEKADLELIADQ